MKSLGLERSYVGKTYGYWEGNDDRSQTYYYGNEDGSGGNLTHLEGVTVVGEKAKTRSSSPYSYSDALHNMNWDGTPKNPSKHYLDTKNRAYELGYSPFRPQAMGLSLNYNFTGLGSGYAGSINIGFVGSDFGIWHTGGVNFGTWNSSIGLGLFMSEWHGDGRATIESFMGEGDSYGGSISIPNSPLNIDFEYSRGFDSKINTNWKTINGGLSIGNPKLPGKVGLEYQPKTYTAPILKISSTGKK